MKSFYLQAKSHEISIRSACYIVHSHELTLPPQALPAAVAAAPQAPPKNPRAREVRLARRVGPGAEGRAEP